MNSRRRFSPYVYMLIALFALTIVVAAVTLYQDHRSTFTTTEHRATLIAYPTMTEQVQPEWLNFYTMNTLFLGAKLTVKNDEGKTLSVNVPKHFDKGDFGENEMELNLDVPADFNLTGKYSITVHFANGTATRYNFERINPDQGATKEASFYLHVCGGSDTSNAGLRPAIYLNGTRQHEFPTTFHLAAIDF
jgi:hypothetical protein